jgi:hypothetical protein
VFIASARLGFGFRGQKRALVALGHNLLIVVYQVLFTGQPYQELGSTYWEQRKHQTRVQHHIRCLRALGALAPGADLMGLQVT